MNETQIEVAARWHAADQVFQEIANGVAAFREAGWELRFSCDSDARPVSYSGLFGHRPGFAGYTRGVVTLTTTLAHPSGEVSFVTDMGPATRLPHVVAKEVLTGLRSALGRRFNEMLAACHDLGPFVGLVRLACPCGGRYTLPPARKRAACDAACGRECGWPRPDGTVLIFP